MRRAVVQNLRTLRRPVPRKTPKYRSPVNNVSLQRTLASRNGPPGSPMKGRRLAGAVTAAAVAGGAWYADQSVSTPKAASVNYSASGGSTGAVSEQVSEAARKALVIDHNALGTIEIPEGQPLSKETDDYGRKVLEMMNDDQVTHKLRTNEESYLVGRGRGVIRYDVVQIPSNNPIEDDHAEKIIDVPSTVAGTENNATSSDWMFWGVFDGHAGWTTSAKLRQALISYVARELNSTYTGALSSSTSPFPSPAAIDDAIKKGFTRLDYEITHSSVERVLAAKSKPLAAEVLAPALSGSCALLSFYDSRSKDFRVACTGDSRAVLGRRSPNGKWSATPLSVDQTGGTESEDARLRKEHPNEPYVTANGRILGGLEPSRAFGDASYKWSRDTQEVMKARYFARSPSKYLLTPPYVTAEPVVTTTKVDPAKGDFVVMATDGLWEMLTNEEVVGLVGMWLEKNGREGKAGGNSSSWVSGLFGGKSGAGDLPIEQKGVSDKDTTGQRAPVRQQQWGVTASQSERFVVEDKNVATHLVRNALGGKDKEMISALLTLPSPYSRRYRDDLTVEVIFFGEGGQEGGNVELNKEASASASVDAVKPRL